MSQPLRVCLPPDPNPRKPRWRLPPGACDTHFHIFGPPDVFPYSPRRRYEPPAAPFEHYMAMAKIVGLTRGVVVLPTAHGTDAATVVDAVSRSNGALLGVTNFDHATPDAALDRLNELGVRGARFSLMSDRAGATDDISHAVKRLQRLGWSLDLHIEPDHFVAQEKFIRNIPVPVVIDHMARVRPSDGLNHPAFRLLLDLLKDDRFWVKLCCPDKLSDDPRAHMPDGSLPFRDVIPFAQACVAVAPDRCIWGSDWPHGNTFEPGRVPNEGDLLDLVAEFAPDEIQRRRIMVDNPARLYGFL